VTKYTYTNKAYTMVYMTFNSLLWALCKNYTSIQLSDFVQSAFCTRLLQAAK